MRQDCNADSLGYSEWAIDGVVTDSMPCLAPDSLNAVAVTNATVTLDWNARGLESMWEVHIWSTTYDSMYVAASHPVTLGGLVAGMSYQAAVRALCGSAHNIVGEWSSAITFATATCPDVTDLTTSNVTTSSVTLSWTANPMAQSWIIEYGPTGFTQGSGITVTCNTNTYVVTGLLDGMTYDFHVKAVCGTGWNSENWANVTATTQEGSVECNVPMDVNVEVNVNNATVSWTPSEGNNSFEIEYGAHGFNHGSGTTATTEGTSYTLSGLDYSTQYDVYVRALCDQSTYSDWSAVRTFTTGTVGIDEANGASCTIYPNPTSAATTISVSGVNGSVRITVVDMNGRTVASETIDCSSDCEKTLDVDNLSQGAYFVRITGENVNMIRKLIVK